jgi:hypothetical protein
MAEILRSPFVTPERIAELRGMGVEISERPDYASLDLPDPGWDEEVIGELTEDEVSILSALLRKVEDRTNLSRVNSGRMLVKIGQHVADGTEKPTHPFENEDDAKAFYRLHKECDLLHSTLYFSIAERLGTHHYTVLIRSRGRVCRGKRLY